MWSAKSKLGPSIVEALFGRLRSANGDLLNSNTFTLLPLIVLIPWSRVPVHELYRSLASPEYVKDEACDSHTVGLGTQAFPECFVQVLLGSDP